MSDIQVNISDLERNLDSLIHRAAQSQDRIVLVQDGEPSVVIISIAALRRLEQHTKTGYPANQFARALAMADAVRQRIDRWQQAHGMRSEGVVETLQQLRGEHDESFSGMC